MKSINPLTMIENLINEHGSAKILNERLLLLKDHIQILKNENTDLKEALSDLQIENTKLRKQLSNQNEIEQFIEYRGAFFKRKPVGGYHETVYCPACRMPLGSLEGVLPYHCDRCHIMLDFNGEDLPRILKQLINENP